MRKEKFEFYIFFYMSVLVRFGSAIMWVLVQFEFGLIPSFRVRFAVAVKLCYFLFSYLLFIVKCDLFSIVFT